MGKKLGMTHDLWWLTLSMGLWGLGFGLYGILWPLYIEKLGGNALSVGILSTIAGISTALVVFPGGYMADRIDRRTVVLWGWVLGIPVPFLFAWAPSWHWLIPGVLLYFGSAFSTPALQAVVVEEAQSEHLSTAYNIVMSVFGAGMVVGPPIGAYLATHWSYQHVFVISGMLYLVSTLALVPVKNHPPQKIHRSSRPQWTPKGRPRLFQWMMFAAGLAIVQGMAFPYVVPFWKSVSHFSLQTIGYLGSVGILCGTVSGPIWGKLGEKYGVTSTMGWGLALVTAGWLAILWAPGSAEWAVVSGILRGSGESARGLQGVAVGRIVRREEAGTAYGLFNLVTESAGALAPLPGGILYTHWPYAPLVLAALLTGMIAWWLVNGLPGRSVPPPPAIRS